MKIASQQKLLADLLKIEILPYFKKSLYIKSNLNFIKSGKICMKVVSFQQSKFGGSFTLNLGLFFPELNKFLLNYNDNHYPLQAHECHLFQRIGFLLEIKSDKWWHICETTDIVELSNEILTNFKKYCEPWLSKYSSYEEALYCPGLSCRFFIPSMHLLLQNKESAIIALENLFKKYEADYIEKKSKIKDRQVVKIIDEQFISIINLFNRYSECNNLKMKW